MAPKQTVLCANTYFALVLDSCSRQLCFLSFTVSHPSSCEREFPTVLVRGMPSSPLWVCDRPWPDIPHLQQPGHGTWSLANDLFSRNVNLDQVTQRWRGNFQQWGNYLQENLRWNPKEAATGSYKKRWLCPSQSTGLFIANIFQLLGCWSYPALYLFFKTGIATSCQFMRPFYPSNKFL